MSNSVPLSGTLPTTPTNTTNNIYYGMTANKLYSITYTPAAGETVQSIQTDSYTGGWPNETGLFTFPIDASNTSQPHIMNYGGKLVWTIKLGGSGSGSPSLSAQWMENNGTSITKTITPGQTSITVPFHYFNSGATGSTITGIECP